MEKLYELHDESDFDLVVVDTPPTRNALDFLEAPRGSPASSTTGSTACSWRPTAAAS